MLHTHSVDNFDKLTANENDESSCLIDFSSSTMKKTKEDESIDIKISKFTINPKGTDDN